ncbi:hypothetical protein CCACVL1_05276 [Corchorus capsularis]|uniref:Uncharacterized protein n=1 Tax=Corchorus capsularis TaxID=210143 RepID=A0A1R3JLK8_COCAP|nr:hypothetical protein CCACVL1_05276 [Corchorus capsularis]
MASHECLYFVHGWKFSLKVAVGINNKPAVAVDNKEKEKGISECYNTKGCS